MVSKKASSLSLTVVDVLVSLVLIGFRIEEALEVEVCIELRRNQFFQLSLVDEIHLLSDFSACFA